MKRPVRNALAIVMLVLLAQAPMALSAHGGDDHARARQALLSGEILSLRQVLERIGNEYPGEPVEIDFDNDDGRYIYKIKLLQPAGSILKMRIDAATGQVIKVKGRGIERRGKD